MRLVRQKQATIFSFFWQPGQEGLIVLLQEQLEK